MPSNSEPISPSTLMGKQFLGELESALNRAQADLKEFEDRFGHRVLKGAVEVVATIKIGYETDPKEDVTEYSVTARVENRRPKHPPVSRPAFRDDSGVLLVSTQVPSDPPPQQLALFPGYTLRVNGRQVDPKTGEVLAGGDAPKAEVV
jgi:hypothetical protein